MYKTKSENIHKQVKTIGLLLDSAEGQNRKFRMEKIFFWFSKVFEVEVLQLFPLRGHSCSQYTETLVMYCLATYLARFYLADPIELTIGRIGMSPLCTLDNP